MRSRAAAKVSYAQPHGLSRGPALLPQAARGESRLLTNSTLPPWGGWSRVARKGPWPEGLSPAPWPPWVGPHEPHCPVNCTCPTYGTSGILSSDGSSCLQESFRPVGPGERPEFNGAFRKADKHHPSLKCVCAPMGAPKWTIRSLCPSKPLGAEGRCSTEPHNPLVPRRPQEEEPVSGSTSPSHGRNHC